MQFNLARETWHQQQWLFGIEQLIAVALAEPIEDSHAEAEDQEQNHTYWSFHEGGSAGQGRWAQGKSLVGDHDIAYLGEPADLTDSEGTLPPPGPRRIATHDGSQGKDTTVITATRPAVRQHGRQDQRRTELTTTTAGSRVVSCPGTSRVEVST